MKKVLLTTIALTAIGVAVRARKTELEAFWIHASDEEKALNDMVRFINGDIFDNRHKRYCGHEFHNDRLYVFYYASSNK